MNGHSERWRPPTHYALLIHWQITELERASGATPLLEPLVGLLSKTFFAKMRFLVHDDIISAMTSAGRHKNSFVIRDCRGSDFGNIVLYNVGPMTFQKT